MSFKIILLIALIWNTKGEDILDHFKDPIDAHTLGYNLMFYNNI